MSDSKIVGIAEDAEEMIYSYSWDYYYSFVKKNFKIITYLTKK